MKLFLSFIIFISIIFSIPRSHSAEISQQQIEQFKSLPLAQQQALAKSMGVDLSAFNLDSLSQKTAVEPIQIAPRQDRLRQLKSQEIETPSTVTEIDQAIVSQFDNKKSKVTLKAFGYDLFAGEPSTFSPVSNIPVPEHYKLGPGDTLSIQLYGKESHNLQLTLNPEGNINIPQLGPVNLAGQSFSEAKDFLQKIINERKIGVKASISMGELRAIRIFVLGEAYKPASYILSSLSTVTQALYAAGGVNNIGSLRNIQIKRRGKLITTFDLYDLLLKGDTSNDVNLMSGDVVFIPTVGKTVGVKGEVTRPAIYEVKNEKNVKQLINLAGGMLPTAYKNIVKIERINNSGLRSVLSVDLSDELNKPNTENLPAIIFNGDVVEVSSVLTKLENTVTIKGHVARAGIYGWQSGMQLSDLLASIDDFKEQPDLSYIVISRKNTITGKITTYDIDFTAYIENKSTQANFTLQPQDTIYVFNKNNNRSSSLDELLNTLTKQTQLAELPKIVKIIGAVRNEGRYPLTHNANVADLLRAGMGYIPTAELNFSLLARKDKALLTSVLYIDLTTEKNKEIQLLPQDRLFIFDKKNSREKLLTELNVELMSQANKNQAQNIVNINGDVYFPGRYPFVSNMTSRELINLAGGFKESSYLVDAELTHFNHDGVQNAAISHQIINLQDNVLLQPLDTLQIKRIAEWREQQVIKLAGEVVFPGSYVLQKNETLSNVIKRAGGLTAEADAKAAIFTRESLQIKEQQQIDRIGAELKNQATILSVSSDSNSDTDNISATEADQLVNRLQNTQAVGRLVINLPRLLTSNPNADIRLDNGDALYIPRIKQSVSVLGEVQYSASHIYDENLTVDQYIAHSGGTKARADNERIYVIKADGSVMLRNNSNWFSNNNNTLSPGDSIVVPLDLEYTNNMTLWATGTQIIYQTAVAIAAISGL
jgi:polysaccharide export outer membrane protein